MSTVRGPNLGRKESGSDSRTYLYCGTFMHGILFAFETEGVFLTQRFACAVTGTSHKVGDRLLQPNMQATLSFGHED